MFLVCDEFGIFTVYSVRTKDGCLEFLLYTDAGWEWDYANQYEPYSENETNTLGD